MNISPESFRFPPVGRFVFFFKKQKINNKYFEINTSKILKIWNGIVQKQDVILCIFKMADD